MKNKEIEELLNKAKDIAKYGADGKQHTRMFNQFEAKALLSYIEQLEKENDRLKKDYSIIVNENCDNLLLEKKVEQLENNRDKAIEYVEKYKYYTHSINVDDLLNILKSDSYEK